MTAHMIEWGGEPLATLIQSPDGDYFVPPIVIDPNGAILVGVELLMAIVESGVTIKHPVVQGCTPEQLAEIDQRLARVSEDLGVPLDTGDHEAILLADLERRLEES
jgi:hypothetical protein